MACSIDLTGVADLAILLAFVVSLTFGILSFRQSERKRREEATLAHLSEFQSESFARMETTFRRIPNNLLPNQLSQLSPELETAWQFMGRHLESLGIAVSLGALEIEVVKRTLGGDVVSFWHKIQPFATAMRKDSRTKDFAQWTEWLAKAMTAAYA